MAIFSIALRGGVILEELILRIYFVVCHLQRFSVLGNTLVKEGNIGTVNFQYVTLRNDVMKYIITNTLVWSILINKNNRNNIKA